MTETRLSEVRLKRGIDGLDLVIPIVADVRHELLHAALGAAPEPAHG